MGITSWALGDENYKTLQDLEAEYSAKYPGMDTSGGVFSDARHAAATNLMSDRLGGGWLGDTAANIGGAAREVPTFVSEAMGLTPSGQSWEDLQANTLAYDYGKGTSAADIYADVFSKYDQSQKAALSNPNYAYGTAQAGHDDWVPKKTGPDPFMATPYLMSKASNLGQSAMHSTPTYDTSDSYLYSTSSGEPVPLPPQLRKPETNWYDGIMNALNPSKADVLARLQANNPAFKGSYYTSRQPSGPWDTGEWGPGPKSDLSDPSGDAFDFEFKEDSTVIDENRIPGRVQESVPNYQNWFERMMSGAQNKLGGAWDKTKQLGARFKEGAGPVFGLASLLANAGNPLNPKSFNFSPDLAAQLNFMDQNYAGSMVNNPSSGLLQYAQGTPLQGQNVMSLFGSNDPVKQLEKQLARRQKTYDNLENQWGNTLTAEELEAKKQNYFDKFLNPTTNWLGKVKADQKVRIDKKNVALALKEKQKEDRKKGSTYSGPQTYNYNPNIQKTGPTYGPHQGSGGGNWGPAGKSPTSGGYSRGSYGGKGHHWAKGGRVGYANGGLATLFTRRG